MVSIAAGFNLVRTWILDLKKIIRGPLGPQRFHLKIELVKFEKTNTRALGPTTFSFEIKKVFAKNWCQLLLVPIWWGHWLWIWKKWYVGPRAHNVFMWLNLKKMIREPPGFAIQNFKRKWCGPRFPRIFFFKLNQFDFQMKTLWARGPAYYFFQIQSRCPHQIKIGTGWHHFLAKPFFISNENVVGPRARVLFFSNPK